MKKIDDEFVRANWGKISITEMARKFNVTESSISFAARRMELRHLPRGPKGTDSLNSRPQPEPKPEFNERANFARPSFFTDDPIKLARAGR